jgi:type IV secretory pathway VirB2 component (pilin)
MKNMIIGLSVKAVTALENGRNWAQNGKLTHRKAFVMGMAVAVASIAGETFAQTAAAGSTGITAPTTTNTVASTGNPINNITDTVCSVSKVLQGPIGIAVIIGCIVIAGLSMAFGGKNSTSLLISALIGGAVVFGARSLLGVVTGGGGSAVNNCS